MRQLIKLSFILHPTIGPTVHILTNKLFIRDVPNTAIKCNVFKKGRKMNTLSSYKTQ